MLKKIWLSAALLLINLMICRADTIPIRHFVIKENPFAQEQIAIVATDSLERIQENVNGLYNFTINGFESELNFQQGTAFYRHKIERSTFMFVRHQDTTGTHSILYYVFKHGDKLSPWHISWMLLLAIPLIIIFAGYLFKRFLIIAAIVLVIFLYFNHHNGLSIPNFFESIFDGLKSLFAKA
ncbi:hypothetical protein HH214_04260 [Mucilaginibacter robiniae]|uniref:Uncharacterized protein n=1 Tax=Mucilaginibacter robiniae TaxID=2728022 RepID=A0A7L5E453_9SPHI|nr:hypothetical protein [Mucilaginibacter robiniae]QJD95146.1 hypothetical protein HH214_04260 [Mucilaginibacter robiniae]